MSLTRSGNSAVGWWAHVLRWSPRLACVPVLSLSSSKVKRLRIPGRQQSSEPMGALLSVAQAPLLKMGCRFVVLGTLCGPHLLSPVDARGGGVRSPASHRHLWCRLFSLPARQEPGLVCGGRLVHREGLHPGPAQGRRVQHHLLQELRAKPSSGWRRRSGLGAPACGASFPGQEGSASRHTG